jgi:DNA mismatch repair ATPase MutS
VRLAAPAVASLAASLDPAWDVVAAPIRPPLALLAAVLLRGAGKALLTAAEACAELDALASLGSYTFAEPVAVFPTITGDGVPRYRAHGLAHPMLPPGTAVLNPVDISPDAPVAVITGSNMSGKSTWLRTLGVNHALALAGAPVRAEWMEVAPHRLYASIAAADSLADGCSRFQAEAKRIASALRDARDGSTVFLVVDELFSGTNSYDRQACAAILLAEAFRLGILLVLSTHDLAIAEACAREHAPAWLFHFEDTLDETRRTWHYRLQPGMAPAGNGLEVARRAGIAVELEEAR